VIPGTSLPTKRAVELAAKYRIPAVSSLRPFAEQGGLMSYGHVLAYLYRRAAAYVAKILEGAKPADLPVQQPTRFDLVINLKTAQALGLNVPPTLVATAALQHRRLWQACDRGEIPDQSQQGMIRSSPSGCPRRAFDCGFLLPLLTAAFGTFRKCQSEPSMSAYWGNRTEFARFEPYRA
jgi:ABC transporter substrate binding protein